jgi:hypothetical protein
MVEDVPVEVTVYAGGKPLHDDIRRRLENRVAPFRHPPGEPADDYAVENRPPWRWRRVFSQ